MSTSQDYRRQVRKELLLWARGKKQTEVARLLGVKRTDWVAWVSGRREFSLDKLIDLWAATGGDSRLLMGGRVEDWEG